MKSTLAKFALSFPKYMQIAFALLALVLLVLGAGAPDDGGYIGR